MNLLKILACFSLLSFISCSSINQDSYLITKGNVTYDFSFAEIAAKYLESADSSYLFELANLEATDHILKHAKRFNYNVPTESKIELVTHLLSPFDKKRETLNQFKQNIQFAKDSIANVDLTQSNALKYLPKGFQFSSKLFFTYGYDLGVVFEKNSSLNLAHPYFLKYPNELKYYSIHELHHAGFLMLKDNQMPSLNITTYAEMAELIESLTHLEGMGTFAPLEIRMNENAMNIDKDYVSIQDSALMKQYTQEYFDIYFHFKNSPSNLLADDDWSKLAVLADGKRLWYRVGAMIASEIDSKLGRDALTNLIQQPSENFIKTYLKIKDYE